MKALLLTALCVVSCCAQAVRLDPQPSTTISSNGSQPYGYPQVLAIPFATVTLCGYPATGFPCTNFATSYTDATGTAACPSGSPVVLAGTSNCSSGSDQEGNFGFWLSPAQNYTYMLTVKGKNYGPYPISAPSNLSSGSLLQFYSSQYAFVTQAFSTALTGGVPATITLPISPIGVNGTDTFHPLYIPGTNPEAVIITGGTCTSAALNCTLTFTPTNSHSGGWRLMSADAGINEALQVCATAGGGIIQVPAGTTTLHGLMDHKSGCSQAGQGFDTTILQVAAGEFASVQGWHAPEYGYMVDRAANGSGVTRSGYSIDMQGSTQTSVPTNTGTVVFWYNQNESLATQVGVLHSPNPANFLPFLMFGSSANNTIQFSKVIDDPLTACTNTGAGGYFIQTSGTGGNKVLSSYGEAGCQAMFQAGTSAAPGIYAFNTYDIGTTTMSAFGQQFDADSAAPGWSFIGNKCIGNGSAPTCYAAISDDPTIETIGVSFTDNDAINAGVCYQIAGQGATKFSRDISITGGHCRQPGTAAMEIQDGVDGLSVTGWTVDGQFSTPNGIFSNSTVSGSIKNISFVNNQIKDTMGDGIHITGSAGITPIDGLIATANTITGNATGLNLPSSTPIGHFNIALNNIWANSQDYAFGITGGAASLVELGPGSFGPNTTSSSPTLGLAQIHQGPDANTAGPVTLANGLNSNVTTDLQGSIEISGPTSAYSVGGFTNGFNGYDLFVFSANGQTLTIVNEDASSTAANRIYTYTGGGTTATPNVTLTPSSGQNVYAHFRWQQSKARWLLLDHS